MTHAYRTVHTVYDKVSNLWYDERWYLLSVTKMTYFVLIFTFPEVVVS